MRTCLGQVTKLRLPGDLARRAREAVRAPRSPAALAEAVPLRLRGFLLEQLFLAELAAGQPSPARAEVLRDFADGAQMSPEQVAALEADAAELYADQRRWLEPSAAAAAGGEPARRGLGVLTPSRWSTAWPRWSPRTSRPSSPR